MTKITYDKPRGTVFSVLNSTGKFHTEVSPEAEGAMRREYETSDGAKGVKYEHVAGAIEGMITNISIYEGDYGKQIQLDIGEGEELVTIFLSTQSSFGEDFMKKLPNIKVNEAVRLVPFSFEDEKGKKRRGLTIYQSEQKVEGYYHKKDGNKISAINGYPEVPADVSEYGSEEWRLFFGNARVFLLNELKKNPLYNKTTKTEALKTAVTPENYPKEDIKPEDIPW